MKMTNAFAILANQGRAVTPTLIDYVQDRSGRVIYRADTRPCEGCNAPDWDGRPMPRPPLRTRQVVDPMTAYQVVHMLEGVVQRGTATILRDLNRPIFGKTGTTTGPTNVWFVGGSQQIVAGVYMGFDRQARCRRLCAGRHARRADLQPIRPGRLRGHAGGPVPGAGGDPDGPDRPPLGRSASSVPGRARIRAPR